MKTIWTSVFLLILGVSDTNLEYFSQKTKHSIRILFPCLKKDLDLEEEKKEQFPDNRVDKIQLKSLKSLF